MTPTVNKLVSKAECDRQGQKQTGPAIRASHAWKKAGKAMDTWQEQERAWQRAKEALRLYADGRVKHTATGRSSLERSVGTVARC